VTQQTYEVNVAKYAKLEEKKQEVILLWEEPRDIFKVVVSTSEPSALSNAKLQYWQNHWPHQRVPKGAVVGAGGSGWMRQDDWYNGQWKDADVNVAVQGNMAVYTFNPINFKEFTDIEDFDAIYRRTLKIRLLFDGERPEVERLEAYSDSVWKETEIKIGWGGKFAAQDWRGSLSVYNGELLGVEPLSGSIKVNGKNEIEGGEKKGSIKANVRFAYNEDVNSFDKTIVTLRANTRSASTVEGFSFLIDEIEAGEKIFVKDLDVLVTKAADDVSYTSFREEWESKHQLTLYDRVKELPEQTFEKAWNDMPQKESRGFMPLGCDGGRQKFGVAENGDIFCPKNWIPRVRGKDTDRLLWEGREIRYRFGFPDVEPTDRHLEDGYLPIIHAKWEASGIVYEQTAFATLLGADISRGRMQGDDPTILIAEVTLTNCHVGATHASSVYVNLSLKSKCDVEEKLEERDGFVFATNYEPNRMRYFVDIAGRGVIKSEGDNLSYEIELGAEESHSMN